MFLICEKNADIDECLKFDAIITHFKAYLSYFFPNNYLLTL
jgi:hypothetical protein